MFNYNYFNNSKVIMFDDWNVSFFQDKYFYSRDRDIITI